MFYELELSATCFGFLQLTVFTVLKYDLFIHTGFPTQTQRL